MHRLEASSGPSPASALSPFSLSLAPPPPSPQAKEIDETRQEAEALRLELSKRDNLLMVLGQRIQRLTHGTELDNGMSSAFTPAEMAHHALGIRTPGLGGNPQLQQLQPLLNSGMNQVDAHVAHSVTQLQETVQVKSRPALPSRPRPNLVHAAAPAR